MTKAKGECRCMVFKSVIEAIDFHAKETPDKICLIEAENNRLLTYGEFWELITAFAKQLRSRGLKKGDHVTVRIGDLLETLVARFGISLSGGVYCPVGRNIKKTQLVEMLEHLESNILISSEYIDFGGEWVDLLALCEHKCEMEFKNDFCVPLPNDLDAVLLLQGLRAKQKV